MSPSLWSVMLVSYGVYLYLILACLYFLFGYKLFKLREIKENKKKNSINPNNNSDKPNNSKKPNNSNSLKKFKW